MPQEEWCHLVQTSPLLCKWRKWAKPCRGCSCGYLLRCPLSLPRSRCYTWFSWAPHWLPRLAGFALLWFCTHLPPNSQRENDPGKYRELPSTWGTEHSVKCLLHTLCFPELSKGLSSTSTEGKSVVWCFKGSRYCREHQMRAPKV